MPNFEVPNLAWVRNLPVIGARLYEALHGTQKAINAMAIQGNLNPGGQVDPPPAIQSVSAIADNGSLHVSIEHTAANVRRGVQYYVEHADNPSFINPQIRNVSDTRSLNEFIGNQTRYVRAYAAYPGSPAGPILYHGGASSPEPVNGGGLIGPAPYLPSQGSGTGAPGQGGHGPGPVPVRTDVSGFDWRLQRPIASESLLRASSPGSQGGIGSVDNTGGGGAGVTVSESVIAAAETLTSIGGTGNAITGVTVPSYSSRSLGFVLRYIPIHANSAGAIVIQENGLSVVAITKNGTASLSGGEFVVGKTYFLMWDGTEYQIVGAIAPISATVLASDSHGVPSVASLADTKIWVGSGSNLPVEHAVSGDAAMSDTGVLTLANSGVTASTYGDDTHVAVVSVDVKGRVTAASSVAITFPGTSGFTGTATFRNAAGTGTSSLTIVNGLITAYTP